MSEIPAILGVSENCIRAAPPKSGFHGFEELSAVHSGSRFPWCIRGIHGESIHSAGTAGHLECALLPRPRWTRELWVIAPEYRFRRFVFIRRIERESRGRGRIRAEKAEVVAEAAEMGEIARSRPLSRVQTRFGEIATVAGLNRPKSRVKTSVWRIRVGIFSCAAEVGEVLTIAAETVKVLLRSG